MELLQFVVCFIAFFFHKQFVFFCLLSFVIYLFIYLFIYFLGGGGKVNLGMLMIFMISVLYHACHHDLIATSKGPTNIHHGKNSETIIQWCPFQCFFE